MQRYPHDDPYERYPLGDPYTPYDSPPRHYPGGSHATPAYHDAASPNHGLESSSNTGRSRGFHDYGSPAPVPPRHAERVYQSDGLYGGSANGTTYAPQHVPHNIG